MIIYKDFVKGQLPDYIIDNDSYKDVNDKGFVERYLEIFADEIDDEYSSKIEAIIDQYESTTCLPAFLDHHATNLGDIPRFLSNDVDFGRFLTFLISIYKCKGTKKSYKALLTTLGFTDVTITELTNTEETYDQIPPILYDSGVNYDEGCKTCSNYDINITTSIPLTGNMFEKVRGLVELIEPINAILRNILWNGEIINAVIISIEIDDEGNLVYNNDSDPGLTLTLVNGDLIINGPNADRYYLEDGNLYFLN